MDVVRLEEISPGVVLVEADRDGFRVRGGVVLGERTAFVCDTLLGAQDMRPVADLVGTRRLVTFYTHAEWDHVLGTAGLPDRGGEVIAHRLCADRCAEELPRVLDEKRATDPQGWADAAVVRPTKVFDDETVVDVSPFTVRLEHVPGHTRDSAVAWVPEAGVLFAGDAVEDPHPFADPDLPIGPWLAALTRWSEEPGLRVVVPSHGAVSGPGLIRLNIAHLASQSG